MSDTEGQLTREVISQRHASAIALLQALEHTAASAGAPRHRTATGHSRGCGEGLAEAFARIYGLVTALGLLGGRDAGMAIRA